MTSCSDLDRLVDDAVAGLPGAAERLAAHADACGACLAEADCAHAPVEALALLADDVCPPDVLAAALAVAGGRAHDRERVRPGVPGRPAARPAPDRTATPHRRRTAWAAVGAAALAVALLFLGRTLPQSEAPMVARTTQPAAGSDSARTIPILTPVPESIAEAAPPRLPVPARPSPERPASARPPRQAASPSAGPAATPAQTEPARPDPVQPEAAPPDVLVAVAPTPADSAAARSDLMLAFAIVSRAQRTADAAVSTELRRVSDAVEPALTL
ncbi:MAG TPA: hypothetical protein VGB53_11320 [Rubricoccaceae bacterium]